MRAHIDLKFRLLHEALMKGCLRVRLQTIRISEMKPTNTLDFLRVRLLRKLWCSSVLEVLLRTRLTPNSVSSTRFVCTFINILSLGSFPWCNFTMGQGVVCFIATRKILGFYISVVHSSRLNVLKEGWDSVSPQFCMYVVCMWVVCMWVVCMWVVIMFQDHQYFEPPILDVQRRQVSCQTSSVYTNTH